MLIHTARSSRSSSSPAAASSRASQLCSLLLLLLMLLVCLVSLSSAQTVTEVITRTTGSASLNRPTRTAAPAASDATTTRSTPAVTSTTIPDLPLSGPQVPFLLQKPIPAQYDDLSRKVVSRMKDVYFTGCPADQVNYVDPTLRINISAVYTQFDPVLGSSNHLADQTSYSSGVLRIVAVGATDSVGRTVNTNVAPQLLSTLSVETQFLTFSVFGNDSYLCDSLYPVAPDPNGTVINGVVIQPAGCLYGPGQVSLGVGIPLNDTYTLGTLWTRIRLSDTSSPPLDIACIEVYANPYDREKWYWKLIFWFPVALAIGFLVVIALARTFCAITSRARAFKNKAREGSQPNIIKDTIAPTLVSALSGQKLALSAALLRFATPGCWDIIMHTQFVAAISMVAVRWPEFSYAFFKQASWSTLTGNVTIIRPAEFDAQSDLLYTNASLPSGDIDAQFSNASSPLYMNQQAPNRFMNLDGARAGMDAYAHAVGLRPRDLFGTCLSIWLLIVAAIVGLSLLAWLVDSFHDTFLRLQKRREDGYSLDVADAPSAAETKEVVDADDDRPRSSISRRGGYRFLGVGGKRLLGSSDNTFHLRMLHGNILRAVFLFHLPITIFTTFQMANADIFSATSVGLAGLAFAFLSVLAPFYVAFSISRAPTAKLYDSIDTLAAFGPVYNNYSPGSQLFCIVDFARTLILGVVIGAGQGNGSAQAIIILVFEIMFALACGLWLPWGEGAMMGPVSFVVNVLRIFTAVLVLLLSPLVDFGREPTGWLTYVILLIQGIVYVCAALILVVKLVEGLVRLLGRASFDERASTRLSGLGGAVRKIRKRKEGKLQLSKNGNKKRLSQTRQPLNRSASSNTQTIMLNALGKDGSTGENTPAVPSSPRRMSTPLPSTMSTNRMPMHSRQASYASYLDSQLQGRRSPADMLADGNGPYSTYLRGDPHDEGFIMAALPSTVASGRAVSPPPQLHQWNGRQSPPLPAPQSGFVRMSGGRATDAAPYQALQGRTQSSQLPRPLSSGSIERMSPTQQFQSLPFQRRPRPQSQIAAVDSYFDPRRQSMPPANQDDGIGLSSTEAAARNATIRRYSQGAQLRASQSIAGMMAVDEEGQPIEPASKKPNGKFWKRGGARSDSDSDDDDDDNGAYAYGADNAAFRSRGGWRGLNKMSAAMSSLAARLGSGKPNGAVAEEGDNSLEPPASEAEGSGTRQGHGGFEVVRPQRPRRSSAAADRALDSTALAAASAGAVAGSMTHPSPTPTAVQPASSAEAIGARPDSRRGVASAADAYSMPAYESQQRALLDELDDSSGTLPPGAADQALLLPSRSSNRPSSAILSSSASGPAAVNEDMFWVSSSSPSASRPQSYAASRPVSASSSRMMSAAATALSTTASTRDSRQQVSTSSSKGRIAEPMQAEVVNAAAEDSSSAEGFATPPAGMVDASEPSMFDADGRLVSSAINFDRAPTHASAAASTGPMQRSTGPDGGTPQVWDAAQAYQ